MMNLSSLIDLYRHMEWADAAVWKSVLASESAPKDAKLLGLLYHLHLVQRAFLRTWRSEPRDTPYPSFSEAIALMSWGRSYYGEAFAHLGRLSDEKLSEQMALPWAELVTRQLGRTPETTTIGDTVLQAALHSLYHRGQINARLREVGGEPAPVDYIIWMWLGRPAPEWPAVSGPA